jgi:hypothetical protein
MSDNYTADALKSFYRIQKEYVVSLKATERTTGVKIRYPSLPEHISENIVKFILQNKLQDTTCSWNCKGDLQSEREGKQECKCFTSDGPPSFTPSSAWDVIYFLDARDWLNDHFILHRVPLKRTSDEWKSIKVSKAQTFEDQCKQGRRPRITWEALSPQIATHVTKIFDGTFDEIFTPAPAVEPASQQ